MFCTIKDLGYPTSELRCRKVQAEKKKTAATRELKQRELRLDVELEEQTQRLADEQKLTSEVKLQFVIRVEGV